MKSETSSKNKGPVSLTDRSIYVVGPRRLQNQLLASFLERETGVKCEGCDDVSGITGAEDVGLEGCKLILGDCLGKDLDSCLVDFDSYSEKVLSQDYVALFNVGKGLGIEEKAIMRGIRGIFYEQDPLESFPKGIRTIFEGELWASREVMTKCILEEKRHENISKDDVSILTQREIEILSRVAVGASNEEIADSLCISPNTVKTHIYNIFKKIKVPNRLQAALWWAAKNL